MLKQKRNKQMHKTVPEWCVPVNAYDSISHTLGAIYLKKQKQTKKQLWEKMGQEGPFLPLSVRNFQLCDSKSNIKTPPHPAVLICCPPEMMFPIVQSCYIRVLSQLLF